ncbi:MAG: hypothetical protein IKZ98_08815 [Clostridia bacterium]|nr:hypothetical protein [Clostridia bacterium]
MKKCVSLILVVILLCALAAPCFAATKPCNHDSDLTYTEHWEKKDEPVYSGACYYQSGGHVHIHEFWKVTVTVKCNKCKKSITYSYTKNIRTYCPCGPH